MEKQQENFLLDIAKYLKPYTEKQKQNWKRSKKIEVFQSESQLSEFIQKAKKRENVGKKLYIGIISDRIAELVEKELGYNIKNFNCALYSDSIRKIFKDHGEEEKEKLRGQRAVQNEDFLKIVRVIGDSQSIEQGDFYNRQPVIKFKKDGMTVVAIVADGVLDLYTLTMYISIKNRSLATPIDEQAPIDTPETTSGTASDNRSLATATDEQAPVNTPETTRSTASNNIISEMKQNTTEI